MSIVTKTDPGVERKTRAATVKGQLSFSLETVTPAQARKYLASAVAVRDRDERVVGAYAAIMKAGAWVVNGQPIIFDAEDRLIDGMQRLSACAESGIALTTLVARGVHGDTLHTIDQHRARSYVAVLEARGTYRRPASLVRLMGKLIRIENGNLGLVSQPISWSRYDRVLDANPELVEAADMADRYRGLKIHSQPVAVLAFMALRAGHQTAFRNFLVALDTEDDDSATGFNGATNLLSTIEAMRTVGDVGVDQMIALGILAFNDWLDDSRRRKVYKWVPDRRTGNDAAADSQPTLAGMLDRARGAANLGLPVMKGYPGLREGIIADPMHGDPVDARLIEELRQTAQQGAKGVSVRMVEVTPDMARRWLRDFNLGNRKVQPTQVDAIARDIKAGRWMVNAQPICFTSDPFDPAARRGGTRLLNGQHRLHGVVEADTPIEVPVASGIAESAFATYDTHARRSVFSNGMPQADLRVIAGAARFQWRVDNGLRPNDRAIPSASELKETLETHAGLAEWFPESRKRQVAEFGSSGVMTFLLYHLRQINRPLAEDYFRDLCTGENLTRDNPVLQLREKIRRTRNIEGEQRGSRREVLTMHLHAWEAYRMWREDPDAFGSSKVPDANSADAPGFSEGNQIERDPVDNPPHLKRSGGDVGVNE